MLAIEQLFSRNLGASNEIKPSQPLNQGQFGNILKAEIFASLNLNQLSDLAPPRHVETHNASEDKGFLHNENLKQNRQPAPTVEDNQLEERPKYPQTREIDDYEAQPVSNTEIETKFDRQNPRNDLTHRSSRGVDNDKEATPTSSGNTDEGSDSSGNQNIDNKINGDVQGTDQNAVNPKMAKTTSADQLEDTTTSKQATGDPPASWTNVLVAAAKTSQGQSNPHAASGRPENVESGTGRTIQAETISNAGLAKTSDAKTNATVTTPINQTATEVTPIATDPTTAPQSDKDGVENLVKLLNNTSTNQTHPSTETPTPKTPAYPTIVEQTGKTANLKPPSNLDAPQIENLDSVVTTSKDQASPSAETLKLTGIAQNNLQPTNNGQSVQNSNTTPDTFTPNRLETYGSSHATTNSSNQSETTVKAETGLKLGQLSTEITTNTRENASTAPRLNNAIGGNILLAQQNAENTQLGSQQSGMMYRGSPASFGQTVLSNPTSGDLSPLDVAGHSLDKNSTSGGQGNGQSFNNNAGSNSGQSNLLHGGGQAFKSNANTINSVTNQTATPTSQIPATVEAAGVAKSEASTAQFSLSQNAGSTNTTGITNVTTPFAKPTIQTPINQVFIQLTKAVQNGDNKITIQLRPEELGRVEVKLEIGGDGRVKAMVIADRPETLDLLQRDSRVLERALQESGLKTDHNSLSFNLQGKESENQSSLTAQNGKQSEGEHDQSDNAQQNNPDDSPVSTTAIGITPDGTVNVLA
ncbi:MAG: hypothetical protein CMM58_09770 [Rhodospirillaceae bacterium]|nr:hypothetical protein [Rhodospirillaceae bacterium]|tara:strand:+ start:143 stop:2404 length:2262 start_codon:yes stop_codon:yes gene_type:complete